MEMLNEKQAIQLKEMISKMVREELKKYFEPKLDSENLNETDQDFKKALQQRARDDAFKMKQLEPDEQETKRMEKDREFRKAQRGLGRDKRGRVLK